MKISLSMGPVVSQGRQKYWPLWWSLRVISDRTPVGDEGVETGREARPSAFVEGDEVVFKPKVRMTVRRAPRRRRKRGRKKEGVRRSRGLPPRRTAPSGSGPSKRKGSKYIRYMDRLVTKIGIVRQEIKRTLEVGRVREVDVTTEVMFLRTRHTGLMERFSQTGLRARGRLPPPGLVDRAIALRESEWSWQSRLRPDADGHVTLNQWRAFRGELFHQSDSSTAPNRRGPSGWRMPWHQQTGGRQRPARLQTVFCRACGGLGHYAADCTTPVAAPVRRGAVRRPRGRGSARR